jgi:uncharacterized membrane protein
MATPASFKGHPIHAILVPLPIGLWIFALVADVMAASRGSAAWVTVAYYCIGGGVAGALLAAVPGLVDLLSMHDPAVKRIGIRHMALNLVAVAVFGLNFVLRARATDHAGPWWLTLVGVGLIGLSGWLGGEMVYRHGVGVEPGPPRTA